MFVNCFTLENHFFSIKSRVHRKALLRDIVLHSMFELNFDLKSINVLRYATNGCKVVLNNKKTYNNLAYN